MSDSVTKLLAAIETGTQVPDGVLADHAVLVATVPNWRLTRSGSNAVREQFATWFADPGHFEQVSRTAVSGGEIVRFELSWTERGVPFTAHQAHFLEVDGAGRIVRDEMYCGGRWDASLLAEMEDANRVSA